MSCSQVANFAEKRGSSIYYKQQEMKCIGIVKAAAELAFSRVIISGDSCKTIK
jgi:hypothetical protein